jgi:hypothetical protein
VAKGGLYTRLHRTQFGIAGGFAPQPQDGEDRDSLDEDTVAVASK